jgi:septum formation protein
MLDNLKKYRIVLASNSPRRRELLAGLGIDFEVRVLPDIDESYPEGKLATADIPRYIAEKKAEAYLDRMGSDELIITADTVVIVGDEVLGKPADGDEARVMLGKISGRTHQVVTGVCIVTCGRRKSFSVSTDVTFKVLTDEETDYYISEYRPFDKAGAYGIQEWIGYVGVTGLEGSYFNVMGLPVQRIYSELLDF